MKFLLKIINSQIFFVLLLKTYVFSNELLETENLFKKSQKVQNNNNNRVVGRLSDIYGKLI